MQEYYLDLLRTLPNGEPNPMSCNPYLLKDAQGRVTDPNPVPADARPRATDATGALVALPQYANDRFRDDYNSPDVKQAVNTHSYGLGINVTKWLGLFSAVLEGAAF